MSQNLDLSVSSNIVLSVEGVSKKFCRGLKQSLFYGIKDIASEITATRKSQDTLRSGEFWAVYNVSFELKKGDAIGLVGANGSGKTSLLRIISGLIKPDQGQVVLSGRVVPLIALGAGFNPILTGRENIYVNLAILGLTKNEINEVFEEVIAFAEINDALDSPVQSYSSGMAARLGFACAVHAKADILLIDEVLSVGDMRFRGKCYRKLAQLREHGTSFILVSHNTNAILSMCNKAVYLAKGKQIMMGDPSKVMSKFEEDLCLGPATDQSGVLIIPAKSSKETTGLDITMVKLSNERDSDSHTLLSGVAGKIAIEVNAHSYQQDVIASALIKELSGESETVLHLSSDQDNKFFSFNSGTSEFAISLPFCGLKPGLYTAKIYLHKKPFFMLDAVESFVFRVTSDIDMNQCLFYQPVDWLQTA